MQTVLLLIASNLFMTMAWYGHLRLQQVPLWAAILGSWGIAFFEYCLQVPANRWGYLTWSAWQLKIAQEILSILVFTGFALAWLGERPRWNHVASVILLFGAAALAFLPAPQEAP